MCYFDHKVMMTLQLGAWETQRPKRPHEREQDYHARLHAQKQAQMRTQEAALPIRPTQRLKHWLQRKFVRHSPTRAHKPLNSAE